MAPREIIEHLPFVMAAGSNVGPQLDLKDLVGAIVIGTVSALGSSYITTKEIAVEVRVLAKQMEAVQNKMDGFNVQHSSLSERLTRIEALQLPAPNGNGAKR